MDLIKIPLHSTTRNLNNSDNLTLTSNPSKDTKRKAIGDTQCLPTFPAIKKSGSKILKYKQVLGPNELGQGNRLNWDNH
jgi:hypothetical protein